MGPKHSYADAIVGVDPTVKESGEWVTGRDGMSHWVARTRFALAWLPESFQSRVGQSCCRVLAGDVEGAQAVILGLLPLEVAPAGHSAAEFL